MHIELSLGEWQMVVRELGYRIEYGHPEDRIKLQSIIYNLKRQLKATPTPKHGIMFGD